MPAGSLEHIGRRLDEIPEDLLPLEQLILVAGLLALAFEDRGLRPVVVGGVAVAIYTERVEATVDVDFVVEGRLAAIECLEQLGFERGRSAGVFWYPRLRVPVEIPDTVLAGDYSRVVEITLHNGLRVPVIGIDDLILDRAEQAAAQGAL